MAVDAEISRQHIRDELALVAPLAATYGWEILPNLDQLLVVAKMRSHTGDLFVFEMQCDDYKEKPPYFEFVDPETRERGTKRAYPKSHDSLFHTSGPCICAPFNRKAYKAVVQTGPHAEWTLGDWQTLANGGFHGGNCSKLGDMLGVIHTRLSRPDLYKGRMA